MKKMTSVKHYLYSYHTLSILFYVFYVIYSLWYQRWKAARHSYWSNNNFFSSCSYFRNYISNNKYYVATGYSKMHSLSLLALIDLIIYCSLPNCIGFAIFLFCNMVISPLMISERNRYRVTKWGSTNFGLITIFRKQWKLFLLWQFQVFMSFQNKYHEGSTYSELLLNTFKMKKDKMNYKLICALLIMWCLTIFSSKPVYLWVCFLLCSITVTFYSKLRLVQ